MPLAGGHLGSRLSQQPRYYPFSEELTFFNQIIVKVSHFPLGTVIDSSHFFASCNIKRSSTVANRHGDGEKQPGLFFPYTWAVPLIMLSPCTWISSSVGPGNTSGFYTLILPSDQLLVACARFLSCHTKVSAIFASFCFLTSFCVLWPKVIL